ncbi:MAG: hypothetical protein KA105_02680 [Caulobacter sp.]|nr:hypothetical protein [Caulobacter sp.]
MTIVIMPSKRERARQTSAAKDRAMDVVAALVVNAGDREDRYAAALRVARYAVMCACANGNPLDVAASLHSTIGQIHAEVAANENRRGE